MNRGVTALLLAAFVFATTASSDARHRHHRHHRVHTIVDANGNTAGGVVRSHKTGALARVGFAFAPRFQAYIDDLESAGATVRFMGGIRRGRCSDAHQHPCGRALDVCQLSRGRVDARCHLPDPHRIAQIAARHGLFEGGQWCSQDYGHAQVNVSAPPCGTSMMARSKRRVYRGTVTTIHAAPDRFGLGNV